MRQSPKASIDDLCSIVTKGTTPTTLGMQFRSSGIPFLRAQNVAGGTVVLDKELLFIDEQTHRALGRSVVYPGDVLVTIAGTIGRAAEVPQNAPAEMNCNQAVAILRPTKQLDRTYMRHWLESANAQRQIFGATVTGTISNLSLGQIRALQIPLPPLDEQKRIAAILDKADKLRQKRRQAIALLDSLTQSIFLEMFGDPANDWSTVELKDAVKPGTIVTYGIVQAGEEFQGGVPYIRTGDIQDGEISKTGLRHTDPQIASKFARSRVEAGEIVMSIRATVGTTAMVPDELDGANLTQGTARIAPGTNLTPEYLLHYLRSDSVQNWIQRQVKGATFREITLTRLRELEVIVPPMQLQMAFSDGILKLKAGRLKAAEGDTKADALFSSLQHRAFSGQL